MSVQPKGEPAAIVPATIQTPKASGSSICSLIGSQMLKLRQIYRLKFSGIAARVIELALGSGNKSFPLLVESLFLRSRWWVNERGETNCIGAPHLIIPAKKFWNRSTKVIFALSTIAIYFALAGWLTYSYVDPAPKGKKAIQIMRPFQTVSPSAVIGRGFNFEIMNDLADSADNNERSPVVIYEDGKPLGPPHSSYADIRDLGMGRFSHWNGQGFVFSSSDNSDPNTNGRKYWAVIP
jgi:hypothetical protein